MIIRKVKMINFRGFREKEINFHNKSVVLLAAANGIGKTTTVDAIEWCLTGCIRRLQISFDTRSPNDSERRLNTRGILKHREAKPRDKVEVFLWLYDGEKERVLHRVQGKDELYPDSSTLTIDGSAEDAKAFVQEYIGNSFYNFHFCDIQKSFNVQSTKREDLNDLFREFITDYTEQIQVAENLDLFVKDTERYIEDAEKKKKSQDVIESKKAEIERARAAVKQIPYPETVFYTGEQTQLTELSIRELSAQKEVLRNCGYQVALDAMEKLMNNEALKKERSVIQEIATYWQSKGATIQNAVAAGFHINTDTISALEEKAAKLNRWPLSRNTILQDGEGVASLRSPDFTLPDFNAAKTAIGEKEKAVRDLSAQIDLLTRNNRMLKLLSSLSASGEVVRQYRDDAVRENGAVRCPVCGSDSFASMEREEILQEADAYIRQNGETAKQKEMEKASLLAQIDELYNKLIQSALVVVMKEKERLAGEILILKNLNDEIQPYFAALRKLRVTQVVPVEEMTAEKVTQVLAAVEAELLEDARVQKARAEYQQILTALGYRFEGEPVEQTHAKVKPLLTGIHEIESFSYDEFVSKLNAIDSILANQSMLKLQQELEAHCRTNEELDKQIEDLRQLRERASTRAAEIRGIVAELSKAEYDNVGPALSKFYDKLARFNANGEFKIVPEKEGISLVDEKGKNVVNILSNGQISVFMLAYFFAGINARNDREKMKVYFIDDLTACMDDVNMLGFMDLLKYQLSSKETVDQLFFITCDDRISKLLKYKLSGRGIELCELLEADFADRT